MSDFEDLFFGWLVVPFAIIKWVKMHGLLIATISFLAMCAYLVWG
jgi:hypothetical protein